MNGDFNLNKTSSNRNKDMALTIKITIFGIFSPNSKHGSFGQGKWEHNNPLMIRRNILEFLLMFIFIQCLLYFKFPMLHKVDFIDR